MPRPTSRENLEETMTREEFAKQAKQLTESVEQTLARSPKQVSVNRKPLPKKQKVISAPRACFKNDSDDYETEAQELKDEMELIRLQHIMAGLPEPSPDELLKMALQNLLKKLEEK